jgi:hypothetical protein
LGEVIEVLLVAAMRCAVLVCLAGLLWVQCFAASTVDAANYEEFWLWSGVRPQAVLSRAHCVYVLQGQIEVKRGDESQVRFIAQGVAVPHNQPVEVWLAYRVQTLHWNPREYAVLLAQLRTLCTCGNTWLSLKDCVDNCHRSIALGLPD